MWDDNDNTIRCCIQSNPLKWIALGPDYEYPLRQSIHLSMFYTLYCVYVGPNKWYLFKRIIHLSGILFREVWLYTKRHLLCLLTSCVDAGCSEMTANTPNVHNGHHIISSKPRQIHSARLRWVLLMLQHWAHSRNRPTATDEKKKSSLFSLLFLCGWYNFGKIVKITATRCRILKLKCTRFYFG